MANSGPGWEGIEIAWEHLNGERERNRRTRELGAEIVGGRVPIATWNAQGRAYVLRRRIRGAKAPFENVSHEFLARSDARIALVQIVHQTPNIEPVTGELLRVVNRFELY